MRKTLGRDRHLRWLWIVAIAGRSCFPIYWMFVVSARSRVELVRRADSSSRPPSSAENYTKPLTNPIFQRYLVNSLIIATCNALLVSVLAVCATYALSRWRLEGRRQHLLLDDHQPHGAACGLHAAAVPAVYAGLARSASFSLFDTQIGLILLYCIFNLPFAIWLLKGIMDGIPIELDEAALVDGASIVHGADARSSSRWLRRASRSRSVLSWVFAWNEYLFAATLTSVNARTVTTGLAEFVTVTGTNWGEMAALSMVSLLPALLFLAFVQRYIVTGLTFGAVKG